MFILQIYTTFKRSTGNHPYSEQPFVTNTPDKAFDGNTGTRWESNYSDPQWITVDLGESCSISGVKIVWENAAGKIISGYGAPITVPGSDGI
ncbi:MAG TPA: discoidin domain-containing protein [Clostridiaceae bacterium]|nr:discoidin domain-containing protein [Clostridiaceae bacterium]